MFLGLSRNSTSFHSQIIQRSLCLDAELERVSLGTAPKSAVTGPTAFNYTQKGSSLSLQSALGFQTQITSR